MTLTEVIKELTPAACELLDGLMAYTSRVPAILPPDENNPNRTQFCWSYKTFYVEVEIHYLAEAIDGNFLRYEWFGRERVTGFYEGTDDPIVEAIPKALVPWLLKINGAT